MLIDDMMYPDVTGAINMGMTADDMPRQGMCPPCLPPFEMIRPSTPSSPPPYFQEAPPAYR